MALIDYEDKKRRERQWYEKQPPSRPSWSHRLFHHPIIFDPERNSFNYVFPKQQMVETLVRNRPGIADKLLIAPCGSGADHQYLSPHARTIYGIDLSPLALKNCPASMEVKAGDILESGYPDGMFDVVASPLFFHHVEKIGFDPYLKEFFRVLKERGSIIILEPSLWYPLNILTRPIKRIFGNPFGEVDDEAPFRPGIMLKSLRRNGYVNISFQAASFSHNAFYVPLAKVVNRLTRPLLGTYPLRYFGWMVVYYAEKP